MKMITYSDFQKIDIRVGTIIKAEIFKEAKQPAFKMSIDFGPLGVKKTSAQITDLYQPEHIIGMQVTAVVNFPPKQIANIMSECLVLGIVDANQKVTLLNPNTAVENGLKIS
ncbi:tRNA-binding protein [Putridiphycobacter roseus]|nr:tRNA-binding protein [Putridiphycobacter roseus]